MDTFRVILVCLFVCLFVSKGKGLVTVNCKTTLEGTYHFTYEWDIGGGSICDHPDNRIQACQEPGSPYVDNEVFMMRFAKCPDVTVSVRQGGGLTPDSIWHIYVDWLVTKF